jgi:hypothetical protein
MRISRTAPHLTAAAQASFSNSQATPQTNPFDDVLPPSSSVRHFFERGQVFGLFSKNLTVELGITHGVGQSRYNCATIEMNMPQAAHIKGYTSRTFSIYKDVESGLLDIGDRQAERSKMTGHPMSDREIGMQLLNWSKTFADLNTSKQQAVISTFIGKPVPEQSQVLQAAKSVVGEVMSYWRRALG